MRLLLDTQVFCIAAIEGVQSFPPKIQRLLADVEHERLLSAASLMEVSVKHSTGKLRLSEEQARQAVSDLKLTLIPFSPEHAYRLYSLPMHHRDPFDRIMIATALVEQVPIIGSDRQFKQYKGLRVIW